MKGIKLMILDVAFRGMGCPTFAALHVEKEYADKPPHPPYAEA